MTFTWSAVDCVRIIWYEHIIRHWSYLLTEVTLISVRGLVLGCIQAVCIQAPTPAFLLLLRYIFWLLSAVKTWQTLWMCPTCCSSGGWDGLRSCWLAALGHPLDRKMSSHGCRMLKIFFFFVFFKPKLKSISVVLNGKARSEAFAPSAGEGSLRIFFLVSRGGRRATTASSKQPVWIYRGHPTSSRTLSAPKIKAMHPHFPPTLPFFSFHNWSN